MEGAGNPAFFAMDITPEMLKQIKAHLRVEGDEEDPLIMTYALASASYVEKYCDGTLVNQPTPPIADQPLPRETLLTKGIWAAMLLMVGHWYNNREASGQSLTEIPLGVDDILFLHRRWN